MRGQNDGEEVARRGRDVGCRKPFRLPLQERLR